MRNEPTANKKVAAIKNISDRNNGKPWSAIFFAQKLNSRILGGILIMNIALRNNLPKKFKEKKLLKFMIFILLFNR